MTDNLTDEECQAGAPELRRLLSEARVDTKKVLVMMGTVVLKTEQIEAERDEARAELTIEKQATWETLGEAEQDRRALTTERDEARTELAQTEEQWRDKLMSLGTGNGPHGMPEDCLTFYNGCHCTVENLVHAWKLLDDKERWAAAWKQAAKNAKADTVSLETYFTVAKKDSDYFESLMKQAEQERGAARTWSALWKLAAKANRARADSLSEHFVTAFDAITERDAVIAERDAAQVALAEVEWVNGYCAWCQEYEGDGHASDCLRQSALGIE